jgi:hypothetical protein
VSKCYPYPSIQVSEDPWRSSDPLTHRRGAALHRSHRSLSAALRWKGLLGGSGRVLGYDPGMLLLVVTVLLLPDKLFDRAPARLREPTDSRLWM